jgi:hypothetical protein
MQQKEENPNEREILITSSRLVLESAVEFINLALALLKIGVAGKLEWL